MGMNPRLLRPILSGDPDALRYIAAVQSADQQSLEPAVRKAITDFIVGCKADGIWSAIKASCILAGARTLSGALVPLVGSAPTNNGPFVSGDYDRKTGLVGNGTSKYLDSNRANNADPQNSQHIAVYVSTASSIACAYIGAAVAADSGSSALGRGPEPSVWNGRSRSAGASGGNTTTNANTAGFAGVSRSDSGSFSIRVGAATSSFSVASNTPSSGNLHVFVTSGGSAFSNGRHVFYSIGESLDLALLDTRVSALVTAIGAAI
jgi:hypothetical protein